MDNRERSASKQINALVQSIRKRVIRCNYDHEKDSRTLLKYLKQAQGLGDPSLECLIINVHGLMNMLSGHLDDALEQYQQNYENYRLIGDVEGMAVSMNNQAVSHRLKGDNEKSLQVSERGLDLVADFAEQIGAQEVKNRVFLLAAKLASLVALGRFDEVQPVFDDMVAMGEPADTADRLRYNRKMACTHRAKAEMELHQGRVDEAWVSVKRALELGQLLNLTDELAEIQMTQAHIALMGEDDSARAESFWEHAEETMGKLPETFSPGCMFAEEAHYLMHRGYHREARRFAQKANGFLNQIDTPEAAQMIRSLSTVLG